MLMLRVQRCRHMRNETWDRHSEAERLVHLLTLPIFDFLRVLDCHKFIGVSRLLLASLPSTPTVAGLMRIASSSSSSRFPGIAPALSH